MIRKKVARTKEIVIDLTGPDGNAFFLLAQVRRFAKYSRVPEDEVESAMDSLFEDMGQKELVTTRSEQILKEMKSGDYEHLIEVFDRHFGHFVILER
jgi:hypothetical protein